MKLLGALINFFYNFSLARRIKNDPERRARSVHFGAKSIGCSITAVLCALMMSVMPLMSGGMGELLIIFWIALFAVGVAGTVICVLGALFNWILQITINRNPVTWISLVFFIGSIVGVAIIVGWVVNMF